MSVLGLPAADLAIAATAVVTGVPLIRIDVREHRLPDRLTGAAALAVLAIAAVGAVLGGAGRWPPMLLTGSALAAGGYLLAVLSPGAFGLGDVKLLGVIGLALGHLDPATVVLWLLALSACSALWLVLARYVERPGDPAVPWRRRHVAFGPPMIAGWWLVYVVLALAAALRG